MRFPGVTIIQALLSMFLASGDGFDRGRAARDVSMVRLLSQLLVARRCVRRIVVRTEVPTWPVDMLKTLSCHLSSVMTVSQLPVPCLVGGAMKPDVARLQWC